MINTNIATIIARMPAWLIGIMLLLDLQHIVFLNPFIRASLWILLYTYTISLLFLNIFFGRYATEAPSTDSKFIESVSASNSPETISYVKSQISLALFLMAFFGMTLNWVQEVLQLSEQMFYFFIILLITLTITIHFYERKILAYLGIAKIDGGVRLAEINKYLSWHSYLALLMMILFNLVAARM